METLVAETWFNMMKETLVQEAVGDVGVGRSKLKLSFFLFALGFTV